MKIFLGLGLFSLSVLAAPVATKRILPVTKDDTLIKREKLAKEKIKALDKKAEDCDTKAKKPIEIKAESISLGGGTAGCSLDDVH